MLNARTCTIQLPYLNIHTIYKCEWCYVCALLCPLTTVDEQRKCLAGWPHRFALIRNIYYLFMATVRNLMSEYYVRNVLACAACGRRRCAARVPRADTARPEVHTINARPLYAASILIISASVCVVLCVCMRCVANGRMLAAVIVAAWHKDTPTCICWVGLSASYHILHRIRSV